MGYTNATCETAISLQPNSTELAAIEACQEAAETPFCWPPNGTRICAPEDEVRWYWPKDYYHNSSKLAIEEDLSSRLLILRENYGNRTTWFSEYMYDRTAEPIPGVAYEKVIQLYIIERQFEGPVASADPYNYEIHTVQQITMVKTEEFTTTRTSIRATYTGSPSYSSGGDDGGGLSKGKIAAIVVPIVILIVALAMICCCIKGCCGCGPKKVRGGTKTVNEWDAERAAMGMQNAAQAVSSGQRPRTPVVGEAPGQIPTLDPAATGRRQDDLPPYDTAPPKYVP